MTGIRLRKATPADLPALVEMEFEAFPGDWISPRSWRDLISRPSTVVTLACHGAELLGCSVLLFNARTSVARLYSLAVRPAARRRGVATLLLEEAAARSAREGATSLRLETRIDNYPAQTLFMRLGFYPIGTVEAYYEDGAKALRYERSVANAPAA